MIDLPGNFHIVPFNDSFICGVVELWNNSCGSEMPYKPFSLDGFREKFIENRNFSYEGTFVCIGDGKVIGFANGICKKEFLPGETNENTPGYLTFILVDKNYRNRGLGTLLLKAVEEYFIKNGKKQFHVTFFNPIKLEWYVPGTDGHDHNNAPGVDTEGPGFGFLLRNGYSVRTREAAFHLDLSGYERSSKLLEKAEELRQKGIYTGFYDRKEHYGFDELFDDLGSEDWRKEIKDNLALEKPYPVIVAAHKGKICGFAGPIRVQESGRGWFAGIGIHSSYRGMGIMPVLFDLLLDGFKKAGARFSTLFTGIENPARKVYERFGFSAVKTWAVMFKEIGNG